MLGVVVAATIAAVTTTTSQAADGERASAAHRIIPAPLSYAALPGETFELTGSSRIVVVTDDPGAAAVAERFAIWLRRPTGFPLPVGRDPGAGDVVLTVAPSAEHGAEGYRHENDHEH